MIQLLNQVPGRAYLLTAVIIFAAANSITRKLTEIGAENLVNGRNPISFCNVLFVGNLCALIVLILVYRRQITIASLKQISGKTWFGLIAVAILSGALAPALIFAALELTAVNNVVLIGRIEPPLALVLSVWLLNARVNLWVVAGAFFSTVGVVLTIFLQPPDQSMLQMMGLQLGRGELMTAAGAITAAVANIISKVTLQRVPLGFFNIVRTAIGTVVFFVAAILLFGSEHFAEAFSPLLWQWMLLYGAVIVVGGQLCWFAGLKTSSASEVSLANSFNPLAGILAAYLILSEVPTFAQYMGGVVILIGIVLNQIGITRQAITPVPAPPTQKAIEQEMEVGFRGI
jgi:drug/metabolite transporter (DMT)-like permease